MNSMVGRISWMCWMFFFVVSHHHLTTSKDRSFHWVILKKPGIFGWNFIASSCIGLPFRWQISLDILRIFSTQDVERLKKGITFLILTLPETNSSPLTIGLLPQKETIVFQASYFQWSKLVGFVSGRVYILWDGHPTFNRESLYIMGI